MRFVEYLNRQRVSRAKNLLIRNTEPMRRIAELSGFRNYNYFFKVFQEIEGMSPSEFMTKNRVIIKNVSSFVAGIVTGLAAVMSSTVMTAVTQGAIIFGIGCFAGAFILYLGMGEK